MTNRPISATFSIAMLLALAPSAGAVPRDLAAQVSTSGLDFLEQEIPAVLPTSFSSPGYSQKLADCPLLGDITVKAANVSASVKVSSMSITPEASGRIRIKIYASGSGGLDGTASPCGLGSVTCHFNVTLSSGSAEASFLPVITNGQVHLTSPSITLDIPKDNVSVQSSGCGLLSSVLNLVIPSLKSWFWGWIVDRIEQDLLLKYVPPPVENALSAFTKVGGQLEGFQVSAQLQEVSGSSTGVAMGVKLDISTTKTGACPLPKPPSPPAASSSPSFSFLGEHCGLALSSSTVTRAVSAAWSAGYFCLSDAKLTSMGLPSTMKGLAGVLFGLTTTSSLEVHAHQAPQVKLVSGSDTRADLTLPGLEVRMSGDGPNGATKITAKMDLKLGVRLRIDAVSRAVIFDLVSSSLGTPVLSATNPQGLTLDPALFSQLIKDIVLPLVEKQVADLEIMPQVVKKDGGILDPYYLYLSRGVTGSDYVNIYARFFRKPTSDSGAPSTSLDKKPSALVNPQMFRFVASGTDASTPTELLRYSWRVDGGSWSLAAYSRAKLVSLTEGKHTVDVRAVDLWGNYDATPASASFDVDGKPPTVSVTQAPPAMVNDTQTTIGVSATDDRTATASIAISARVERQKPGATQFETVREDPFAKGLSSFALQPLEVGTYKVTFIARDEAGNLSEPAAATFACNTGGSISPAPDNDSGSDNPAGPGGGPGGSSDADENVTGGCSVTPVAPAAPALLLAVLLLGVSLTLRRRPR